LQFCTAYFSFAQAGHRGTCLRPLHIFALLWNRDLRCHFEWPCATLSDLAKYSVTQSIARSLCDSWVSRFLLPVRFVTASAFHHHVTVSTLISVSDSGCFYAGSNRKLVYPAYVTFKWQFSIVCRYISSR